MEWNMLSLAVASMRECLDPGSQSLALQDFWHARQSDKEPVGDFILRLERLFRSAHGREAMSGETLSAILYGQLQEGLLYELVKAPAVSGAQKYEELSL